MNAFANERAGLGSAAAESVATASISAVAWGAILAGAAAATGLTLVLIALGAGFGLASVSPWSNAGASASTFTALSAVWLIVAQWLSAGTGGYLAGRLRTKWAGTHTHEVFFRDTAHGFVTWAVSTLLVLGWLSSAAASLAGGGLHAVASATAGAGQTVAGAMTSGANASGASTADGATSLYDVDTLFRAAPDAAASGTDVRAETLRILTKAVSDGQISSADRNYLAELVATRAGLSQDEAQRRVDAAVAAVKRNELKAKQAADEVRKSAARTAVFTGLSMLIGAFVACIAAALGGHRRDVHP